MLMVEMLFDKETLKKFSTQTIIAGVLMLLVGMVGIFAPSLMSVVVVIFLGWLFLVSAAVQSYITYRSYRKSFSAWLKPLLSLIVGLLFFIYPIAGAATVGLLLVTYLLIDAYSSFGFAMDYRPNSGWWLLIVNALVSLLLAVLILVGWPISSMFWVGLYAGVSLFFDGVALVAMGLGARKMAKNDS